MSRERVAEESSSPRRRYPKSDKSTHYVDNDRLLEAFVEFRRARLEAEAAGLPEPPLPRYVAESIITMCEQYSTKRGFSFLPYREEMVGDAILTCARYASRFDPAVSRFPFAYITMIIKNAFFQRIKQEKREEAGRLAVLEKFYHEEMDHGTREADVVAEYLHGLETWQHDVDKLEEAMRAGGTRDA